MTQEQKRTSIAINIYVTCILVFYLASPIVAYIMNDYPEVPAVTVRSLVTIPNLIALFVSFIIGPLATKVNKKLLLVVCSGSMAVYSLGLAFIGLFKGPFILLIICSCFAGICQGGAHTIINSIISEQFEGEELRARRIARYNVFINAGAMIIILLGGNIAAGNGGANWPYAYMVGFWCIPATIAFLLLMPKGVGAVKKKTDETKIAENAGNKEKIKAKIPLIVVVMALVHLLFYIGVNTYNVNLSEYVINEFKLGTSAQTGLATTINRAVVFGATFFYPVWQKLLKKWLLPVGYALVGLSIVTVLVNTSLTSVYLAALLQGIGITFAHSTIYAVAVSRVPTSLSSVASGLIMGMANLGVFLTVYVLEFIGNIIGGGIMNRLSAGLIFIAAATVFSIFLYPLYREKKGAAA